MHVRRSVKRAAGTVMATSIQQAIRFFDLKLILSVNKQTATLTACQIHYRLDGISALRWRYEEFLHDIRRANERDKGSL